MPGPVKETDPRQLHRPAVSGRIPRGRRVVQSGGIRHAYPYTYGNVGRNTVYGPNALRRAISRSFG